MLGSRFDFAETLNDIATQRSAPVETGVSVEISAEPSDEIGDPLSDLLDLQCIVLEQEMIAVARTLHSRHPKVSFRCPVCDDRMSIRSEKPMTEFGALEVKLHELECTTCGMLTGRVFHPSVGYHALVR